MKPTYFLLGTLCMSLVACDKTPQAVSKPGKGAIVVNVIGCLTTADNQFVLTELEPATGAPRQDGRPEIGEAPASTTDAFLIVSEPDDLRQYAGKEVRIVGVAEPARLTDVVELASHWRPASPVGTSGQQTESLPSAVSSGSRVRLKMSKTWVTAITPLGDRCVGD